MDIWSGDPSCPACGNPVYRTYRSTIKGGWTIHCQYCEMSIPLVNAIALQDGTFRFKKDAEK